MATRKTSGEIQQVFLKHVQDNPSDIVDVASKHFGRTPQTIRNHLNALIEQGAIQATGATRALRYELLMMDSFEEQYEISGLAEDVP